MQENTQRSYGGHLGSGLAAAAGNSYGQDVAVPRQLEIPGGIHRVENNLGALHCVIDSLDSRLSGYIARPVPPQPTSEKQQLKGAMSSGLGRALDNIAEQVDRANRRLTDLLERLEA